MYKFFALALVFGLGACSTTCADPEMTSMNETCPTCDSVLG